MGAGMGIAGEGNQGTIVATSPTGGNSNPGSHVQPSHGNHDDEYDGGMHEPVPYGGAPPEPGQNVIIEPVKRDGRGRPRGRRGQYPVILILIRIICQGGAKGRGPHRDLGPAPRPYYLTWVVRLAVMFCMGLNVLTQHPFALFRPEPPERRGRYLQASIPWCISGQPPTLDLSRAPYVLYGVKYIDRRISCTLP